MKPIRPTKIRAAGIYSSSVPCDLKNACKSLSLTTSHNWSRVGHSTWFDNRNALKCLCFLTGRGLSPTRAVPVRVVPGLSVGAIRLQLEGPEGPGLSRGAVRLRLGRPEGQGLSAGAVCLRLGGPGGPGLSARDVRLRLGGPILAGSLKFEKNWYHFVFVSNVTM